MGPLTEDAAEADRKNVGGMTWKSLTKLTVCRGTEMSGRRWGRPLRSSGTEDAKKKNWQHTLK